MSNVRKKGTPRPQSTYRGYARNTVKHHHFAQLRLARRHRWRSLALSVK